MPKPASKQQRSPRVLGVATLELVLILPLILLMFVGIVWLGFSIIGQATVAVEARADAWRARFGAWNHRPLDFFSEEVVERSASDRIEVTPVLSSEDGPESKHSVQSGPWDHRNVPFRSMPNWQMYADVGIAAKNAGVQATYEDARNQIQSLQSTGDGLLAAMFAEIAESLDSPGALFAGSAPGARRTRWATRAPKARGSHPGSETGSAKGTPRTG